MQTSFVTGRCVSTVLLNNYASYENTSTAKTGVFLWQRSLAEAWGGKDPLSGFNERLEERRACASGLSKVANKKPKKNKQLKASKNKKPLCKHTEDALKYYFASLNGDRPGDLYDLVIGEVERPLFKAVMDYTDGNQSQAAGILGINRGTLRKKLRTYSLIH